jgi:hypothetical protein
MSHSSSENCPNCGSHIDKDQLYCSQCGQAAHLHRINAGYLLHEAIHYFTHADKGIFFLLKSLTLKPGEAARQYIKGQRRRYFAPLTFFLLAVGVMVFGVKMSTESVDTIIAGLQAKISAADVAEKRILGFQLRGMIVRRFTSQYSNLVSMLATPLLVVFMWLCYKKQPYNYMEHLVANLYFTGYTSLFYGLLFVPLMRINGGKYSGMFLVVYFVFEIIYRTLSYYYFVPSRGTGAAVKAFLSSLLASLFWAVFSSLLIFLYIRYGG